MIRKKDRSSASPGKENGFTLLETAIAAVVLMIVGLGAAGIFAYTIGKNSGASDRAASLSIAQAQVEKMRALNFTDTTLNTTQNLTATCKCTTQTVYDAVGRGYTVQTSIWDTVVNSKITLKKIEVLVIPIGTGGPLSMTSGYFGSVKLTTERCNPVPGTNIS
jgi:type II secretory pathway pseudopilin PulG